MESTYKQTLSGSVGAGIGSLINPNGKKYYILEHKTDTLYHKTGDSDKVIIDEIELGRDAKCYVRFDESCETVSRHHAAIVKDGEGWKIINLSKTNSTLVNGQPINGEWHLSSGDEIQLSSRGPIIGFIIPQGAQATVDSIGLSERFTLFRQQALRPYKVATTILSILVLLALAAAIWAIVRPKVEVPVPAEIVVPEDLSQDKYLNSVYFIQMNDITIYTPSHAQYVSFKLEGVGGTGFMLKDGRFVTSNSMIQPWYYFPDENIGRDESGYVWTYEQVRTCIASGYEVIINYTAFSASGSNFQFRNTDMLAPKGKEVMFNAVKGNLPKGHKLLSLYGNKKQFKGKSFDATDNWATMSKKEQLASVVGLDFDIKECQTQVAGDDIAIFGFPANYGFVNSQLIRPQIAHNNINVNGLNHNQLIELSSKRYEKGFDGAPLLVADKVTGAWKVIGVLSHTADADRDVATPVSNLTIQ
jgi:FOG: FHA domain